MDSTDNLSAVGENGPVWVEWVLTWHPVDATQPPVELPLNQHITLPDGIGELRKHTREIPPPTAEPALYGPHCHHADLCSMFGCDQRGHIDFPCRRQATCTFCHPTAPCPMNPDITAADCPECHVDHDDVTTPLPADEAPEVSGG